MRIKELDEWGDYGTFVFLDNFIDIQKEHPYALRIGNLYCVCSEITGHRKDESFSSYDRNFFFSKRKEADRELENRVSYYLKNAKKIAARQKKINRMDCDRATIRVMKYKDGEDFDEFGFAVRLMSIDLGVKAKAMETGGEK